MELVHAIGGMQHSPEGFARIPGTVDKWLIEYNETSTPIWHILKICLRVPPKDYRNLSNSLLLALSNQQKHYMFISTLNCLAGGKTWENPWDGGVLAV